MTNPNETPDLAPMAEDLIRSEAPDEALEALLEELEETAEELRQELLARGHSAEHLASAQAGEDGATAATADGHRKPKKTNPHVTPEQQAELDENFARYWSNSQGSWKNLFRLLREFRAEMKDGKTDD